MVDVQGDTINIYPDNDFQVEGQNVWVKYHYPERIAEFKEQPLTQNDIVFLGNSITEHGEDWSQRFGVENIKNRGIGGDVTIGVLARLGEIYYFKPKAVFLLIGINDLNHGKSPEYTAANIVEIAERIHQNTPKTRIYVQTILPTSEVKMIKNINQTNQLVKSKNVNTIFQIIDLHEVFVNKDGLIKDEFSTDGLHLSELGYQHWVNKEKTIILGLNTKE